MKKIIFGVLALVCLSGMVAATPVTIKEGRQLDRFYITNVDTTLTTVEYYGYLAEEGDWYIMREDKASPDLPIFKYAGGSSGYALSWTSREALSYYYFNGQ